MLLSGQEILRRKDTELLIEPFSNERLNPNSYNLALHDELLVYEEVVLDAASPNRYRRLEIPAEGLTLQPNMLYLGRTVEYTETRGFVPMIQGRSSLGRSDCSSIQGEALAMWATVAPGRSKCIAFSPFASIPTCRFARSTTCHWRVRLIPTAATNIRTAVTYNRACFFVNSVVTIRTHSWN